MNRCHVCGNYYEPTTTNTNGVCYKCRGRETTVNTIANTTQNTGDISSYKEPEPTHTDILAAIQALREDIQNGDAKLPTLEDVMKLKLDLSGGLSLDEWLDKKHGYPKKITRLTAENAELKEQLRLIREGERRP